MVGLANSASVADWLAEVSLFASISAADRSALARLVQERAYRGGQRVFMAGDAGDRLYIIKSGMVKIGVTSSDGREVTLALLGPGEFFGELALLDGLPRSSDAVTVDACHFLLLRRDDFLQFVVTRPEIALHLLEVLSRRLRNDNDLVQDATLLDVPARLARVLLRLCTTAGQPVAHGTRITLRLTQSDLAGMAGASRESVNKCLVLYEQDGLIRRERGLIVVPDPELLEKRIR